MPGAAGQTHGTPQRSRACWRLDAAPTLQEGGALGRLQLGGGARQQHREDGAEVRVHLHRASGFCGVNPAGHGTDAPTPPWRPNMCPAPWKSISQAAAVASAAHEAVLSKL
jgi:hypothetical protein